MRGGSRECVRPTYSRRYVDSNLIIEAIERERKRERESERKREREREPEGARNDAASVGGRAKHGTCGEDRGNIKRDVFYLKLTSVGTTSLKPYIAMYNVGARARARTSPL